MSTAINRNIISKAAVFEPAEQKFYGYNSQLSLRKDALAFHNLNQNFFCLKGLDKCGQKPNVAGVQQQTAIFTRVVGGVDAEEGAWPWQAIVLNEEINVFSVGRVLIT